MRSDAYFTIMDTNYCYFKNCCNKFGTDECDYKCRQLDQMKYMLDLSNLPKKFKRPQKLQLELIGNEKTAYLLENLMQDIEYFVENGYNAYFYGNTGSGKTSWAVKLMTTYFCNTAPKSNYKVRGLYISVPEFLRDAKLNMTYRDEDFKELLDTIKECDIVIWDDIMQTDPTAYESQWLYSYINGRLANGLSNIFTSNLSPEEMSNKDARMYSRVCNNSDVLLFNGNDARLYQRYSRDLAKWEAEWAEEQVTNADSEDCVFDDNNDSENYNSEENELNISEDT